MLCSCFIKYIGYNHNVFILYVKHPCIETKKKEKVWHKFVPLKAAMLAWQLFQDRVPSKQNLIKREILTRAVINCKGCCVKVES
jgi:hypothetical protein